MPISALLAFLDEPGLVEDEYAVVPSEVLEDVFTQVVAYLVGIPVGAAEQMLESVGSSVSGVLGDLPGVLPFHRAKQATYVITRAST